jgi:hypothetical protein
MPHGKPHIRRSFRLPEHQIQQIQVLKRMGVFGTKESDIVRNLIQYAINEMNRSKYIETHYKGLEMIKRGDTESGTE